jgi:HlyD family secretion protein
MSAHDGSAKARRLRPWHSVVVMVVALIAAGAIYSGRREDARVKVVHPVVGDVATTVSSTGLVIPARDFPARANFSGMVEGIYVHLGEKVHAGQLLLRLKDQYALPRLRKAQAELDEAELNEQNVLHNGSKEDRIAAQVELEKAQTDREEAANALAAMKAIQKDGSVTPAEVQTAEQRLAMADANLKALKQKMTARYSAEDVKSWRDRVAADKATVQAERVSWRNAHVFSPVSGTVYAMPVNLWDFVPAGTDLLHVADLSHLEVRAEFEEADIGMLHDGEPVTVTWDGEPGRVWHGHIVERPMAVTRTPDRNEGTCLIVLDDARGDLPLDSDVAVVVTVARDQHVLTLPREAVHTEGQAHFVYVVKDGELKKTPVEVGLANAMNEEIRSGVKAEDTIALRPLGDATLREGLRVESWN